MHVHAAVTAHKATARHALDLRPGDIYWCTADPGWVTGTSYGIIAPLAVGATLILDEAEFDAERWYATSREAPRQCLVHGADRHPHADQGRATNCPGAIDLSALRFIASVGEPLHPEAVIWGREVLGPPDPRQLVAERDRRHHDRQHRRHGNQARLDGQGPAGHQGGHRPAHARRVSRKSPSRRRRRTGAAARLAFDVPRLSQRG